MRRSTRHVILGTLVLLLVTGGSVALSMTGGDSHDAPVADPDQRLDAQRYQAALAAQTERIARSRESLAKLSAALEEAPDSYGDYVVSLSEAVPAKTVIEALKSSDVGVLALNTWLLADGSLYPKTGTYSWSSLDFNKSGAAEGAALLKDLTLNYLLQTRDHLKESLSDPSEDESFAAGLERDLRDIEALIEEVQDHGAAISGFECVCSPREINSVAEQIAVPLLAAEDGLTHEEPLPLEEPLIDRILSSTPATEGP